MISTEDACTGNVCSGIYLTKCLDSGSTSDETTVSCTGDQRVVEPGVIARTTTTTTYRPPTGVPGMTGATGDRVNFHVSHFIIHIKFNLPHFVIIMVKFVIVLIYCYILGTLRRIFRQQYYRNRQFAKMHGRRPVA